MRSWWLVVPLLLAAACDNDDDFGPGPGRAPLTPTELRSVSLDGAIALTWADDSFTEDPDLFSDYRVYSTSYDLDRDLCGTSWSLEGTTVAPEFVVGSLDNGVPRCFAVTAESVEGVESARSELRQDTPRPDARNIVLNVRQVEAAGAGFRFWQDLDGDGRSDPNELGLVARGDATDIDFAVDRDPDGTIFLTPVRAGTSVAIYGETLVEDLTSIDVAPETGFDESAVEAKPMWGYVFETSGGDDFPRYGAVRVTHVGQTIVILDWAFQTDPGNPALVRVTK
jgi:hypothetical protein